MNRQTDLPVEIVITAEIERCPGPLALGDVVWSTTLLPGERVRLFTSTRNNRFTYDQSSQVSYRHEQASEETYYMTSVDRFMSDLTVSDRGGGSAQSQSAFETEGSVPNWVEAIFSRPDARIEGEFSAESSVDFFRDLRRHAEPGHERSVQGTRAANSIAIGEVQSRGHASGESEHAFEASTRKIENLNQCHAVTYFAYELVNRQPVTFRIKSVLRRVIDPAGNAGVSTRPLRPNANVAVIPGGVLSTNVDRLAVQTTAQSAAAAQKASGASPIGVFNVNPSAPRRPGSSGSCSRAGLRPNSAPGRSRRWTGTSSASASSTRWGGKRSPTFAAELEFTRTTCLPTQGIVAKGCLAPCTTCEEPRRTSIALDLERKALENRLLERQIELLEKHQDYRCCPAGEAEEPMPA